MMRVMKIISGGQTGVDRAALDVAIERGIDWGGWCPKGGWAEDLTEPPGLLATYPHLKETPDRHPLQRTEWNVRDGDAILIVDRWRGFVRFNRNTARAQMGHASTASRNWLWMSNDPDAAVNARTWLRAQKKRFGPHMVLSIGGPRESEAPGIYKRARHVLAALLKPPP